MLSFASDYVEGAHPAILQRFIDTNLVKQPGYGSDEYTASAKEKSFSVALANRPTVCKKCSRFATISTKRA